MWPFHPNTCPYPNEPARLVAARQRAALTGYDTSGGCISPGTYPDLPVYDGRAVVEFNPDQSTLLRRYLDEALEFIDANRSGPFFLYLPLHAPHVPLFPSAQFLGSSGAGLYGDVVQEIDWLVGQILERLAALGIDDETLVLFTSDNGPWLQYGIDGGSPGPLRGGKRSMFEGGLRVPMVARWPGQIAAGAVANEMASHLDLTPTLAGLAGAPAPALPVDGLDIWPMLSGQPDAKTPHDALLFYRQSTVGTDQTQRLGAIRQGRWKLHLSTNGTTVRSGALYDLAS
jgi:arylsulfatase A-like enzyme